jgi:hypothetical protein
MLSSTGASPDGCLQGAPGAVSIDSNRIIETDLHRGRIAMSFFPSKNAEMGHSGWPFAKNPALDFYLVEK